MTAYEEGYTGSAEDARSNLALNAKTGLRLNSRTSEKKSLEDPSDLLSQIGKSRDPRMKRLAAMQKDAARNASKNAAEFVMAKGMTGSSAQLVRYRRTVGVLKQCGNGCGQMLSFYENQNRPKYDKLKKRIAAKQKTTPSQDMAKSTAEMGNINNKKDAMKFIAGGGANRHMQSSMRMMGSMSSMFGEESYRGDLTAQDCQRVKQKAQTAQLNIRL